MQRDNDYWIEVARKLNNKGISTLKDCWDMTQKQWKTSGQLRFEKNISLQESILVGRLLEIISLMFVLQVPTEADWKAWKWPEEKKFEMLNTKSIYLQLCANDS